MLLLLPCALAASDPRYDIGLDVFPVTPADADPHRTGVAERAAIDAGERPVAILPFHFDARGWDVPAANWYDDKGRVYRRRAVLRLLREDAASRDEMHRHDAWATTGGVAEGVVGAGAIALLLTPAAPVVPAFGLLIGGEGLGLSAQLPAEDALRDAVRAYNLAHAVDQGEKL